jgi:CYTH domain-containing protein
MNEGNTKNEIERKWILRDSPYFKKDPDFSYVLLQFYMEDGWRYRMSIDNLSYKKEFFKTKKTPNGLGSNIEEEYSITELEYQEAYKYKRKEITKSRYIYIQNGLKWEVDHFSDMKLVIMEVELDSIDQKIEIPQFLQDLIIYEVTGIKEFNNSSLAK